MRIAVSLVLGFVLMASALAEELYVRNRPFKGLKTGTGEATMVDLEALSLALGLPCQKNGDTLVVGTGALPEGARVALNGNALEHQAGPAGQFMVSLKEVTAVLGGRLVPNRDLGTLDFFYTPKTAPPEVAAATPSRPAPTGSHAPLADWQLLIPRQDPESLLYGYINVRTKEWVIPPQFAAASNFSLGYAPACVDKGLRTKKEKHVDAYEVTTKSHTIEGGGRVIDDISTRDTKTSTTTSRYREGGKWGMIDTTGKWFIQPRFDEISGFGLRIDGHDGLVATMKDSKGKITCYNVRGEKVAEYVDGKYRILKK